MASMTPSGATAVTWKDDGTDLTDWWCELLTGMLGLLAIRRSRLLGSM